MRSHHEVPQPKFVNREAHHISREAYHHKGLITFGKEFENRRVSQNPEFKVVKSSFDKVECKEGGAKAYTDVVYDTLQTATDELHYRARVLMRFNKKRAEQRSIQNVAKSIAFGTEQARLWATKMRGRKKRKLKKKLFQGPRVVFFGDAQIGICPRMKIIRALSFLCGVAMIHEFRTSIRCYRCGCQLSEDGSRVLRCDNNGPGEGFECKVGEIDRGVNGGANMLEIGLCQLKADPRPKELCRPPRNTTEESQ